MSNIFSDKRKLFGTILGLIMFALTIVSITYAYYSWRSSNTIVTFNIQDNIFYCQTDVDSSVNTNANNTLSPVNNYRDGIYQAFIVKNIGRQDTTFSLTMNVTNISSDVIKHSTFKYKLVYDPTGGSIDCTQADATSNGSGNTCINVSNGTGDFSNIQIGMNTLVQSISLPNNSKYKYYFFMYLDGQGGQTPSGIQSASMTSALGVCDIYATLDVSYIKLSSSTYQMGGNCASVSPDRLKLTADSTYGTARAYGSGTVVGLPTPTRSDTTISFNSNASGVSNPSNKTVKYDFGGWYINNNFTGSAITNNTNVTTTENQTLYAKWTPNTPSSGSITLPSISRAGYTFDGWYTAASGGTRVGGIGDSYLPTDCTKTLYAHWTAISKTINIRKDNAAWSSSGVTIGLSTSDSVYITDGNGKTVIDQEVANTPTVTFVSDDSVENGIIAAGTPYYVWVGKDSNHKSDMVYTGITFNGNDNTSPNANYYTLILRSNHVGSMEVNRTSVSNAGSVIVASNWPHDINSAADTGYSFASWSKTAGGGTVTFGDASQAKTTANVTVNSATITASANIIPYTITLKAGNGISTLTADGWTNSPAATITKSYNYNSTINLANIVTPNFKTGYSGVSYTKTSGSGTLSGSSFTVGAGVTTITINATALAAPTCTTITGGTTKIYNYQDTILTATNSTSYDSGVNLTYQFGYAADNETAFASYANSNVSGHPNQYSVTKALYRGTKHYGVKITATGDGGLTNSCTMSPGSGTAMTLKNKKITFNATQNGGTLSGTGTLYIAYDNASVYTTATEATAGTIPTATKGGFTFDGWFTANGIKVINANGTLVTSATDNGTVWTSGGKWANTSVADATLYAQFVTNSYTVSYASTAACPLPSGSSSTGYSSATVHFGDVINKANPTCTGYNFDGWTLTGGDTSTAKYGTTNNPTTAWVNKNKGTYFKNLASTAGATPTMTANWVAKCYTVTVKAGAGISSLARTGWSGTGTGTLTKELCYGTTDDLSGFTPTYKNGYSGRSNVKTSGAGSISGNTFTVGDGVTTITVNATAIETPSCTVGIDGGTTAVTKIYGTSTTALSASISNTYDSSINVTYTYYYDTSSSGSYANTQSASISATSHKGIRYYKVKATATGEGSLSSNAMSSNNVSLTLKRAAYTPNANSCGTLGSSSAVFAYKGENTLYGAATGGSTTSWTSFTVKSGWDFLGWYTLSSNGYEVLNTDGSIYQAVSGYTTATTYDAIENKTLYAQCSPRTFSATIYYNSNSTSGEFTAATKGISCIAGSNGTCTANIPSDVTGSLGKYNTPYHGLSNLLNNMSATISKSSSTITLSESNNGSTYYAIYGGGETTGGTGAVNSNVIIRRPTVSTCTTQDYYRNEFFSSTSAMSTVLSQSATGTSNQNPSVYPGYTFKELRDVGSSFSGNAYTVATAATSTVREFYSIETKTFDVTLTIWYNSNATVGEFTAASTTGQGTAETTKYCRLSQTQYKPATDTLPATLVSIPSEVINSVGKYNTPYHGLASAVNSMNLLLPAQATSYGIPSNTTLYAIYSSPLTIYYPDTSGGVSSSNTASYRNEYFTNVTLGSEAMGAVTSTSQTNITQATNSSVSLPDLKGTLLGITPTANTNTGYLAVNSSGVINSGDTTYYVVTFDSADNATLYYNSNTTPGEFTPSTATITGTSIHYCIDTSTQGTHGSTINLSSIPSTVTDSVGKWNTPYHGISSSVNSMNLASSMTTGGSYYAVYGAGETTGGTGAVNSNVDEYYSSSNEISNFSYTGSAQTFTASGDGIYKVELWGAQGGPGATDDGVYGKGGYSSGNIRLGQNEKLYVYVGQRGPTNASVTNVGGWNGGGYSGNHSSANSYGGGGATDVRLVLANASDLTVWNEATSLRSRIMVAGGGGGGSNNTSYSHQAGVGGGLIAEDGSGSYNSTNSGGGTQTGPGTASTGKQGSFGYAVQTNVAGFGGGGGGGYWGGSTGHGKPGGGGSSYISGYEGSVAVASASSSAAKSGCANGTEDITCSYHYSGKIFTDTDMRNGYDEMPTHDGTSDMQGNEGNGYAKITKIVSIRLLYRNEYFTSATGMNTVLSTTTSGTTNITTSAGVGNSSWYGYGTDDAPDLFSHTYDYTGSVQTFTAPKSANYSVQLLGARGGNGAYGGYTSGNIFLNQSDELYVYVGQKGPTNASVTNVGGWNGGGYSGNNTGAYSYGGGGATDVRLVKASDTTTVWNEPTSLRSRIMVAAGGGGSTNNTSFTHTPGGGGGLTGGTGTSTYTSGTVSGGGTQTGPGIANSAAHKGLFGSGPQSNPSGWGGGGGGGYWGGSTGYGRPGGGGSSYISGYTGAVAVKSEDSSSPKDGCTNGTTDVTCSYHYSKKVFSNAYMEGCDYSGQYSAMFCYGTSSGNGKADITQLDNNTRIRTYSTVSTAAQSTSRTLYGIYQMSVNYQKGSNVTEIGDTSGNCLMNYDDNYCSVGAPSITPDYGYDENGWSTTQNDSNYGIIPTNEIKLTMNNNTYYGNATNTAVDVTYISGYNHMTGLDDIGVTSPIGGVGDTTNRMSYSITDGVVTVTGKDQYGYGMTTGRVYLEAGHTYLFSCDTDGVWGQTANTGQVYAHLMLNGSAQSGSTWYGMASPNNYIFTATVTGEYWLRLAVSKANETHTFSDIDIQEIYGIQHAHYGDNYQVPSSNPTRSGHTFIEWHNYNEELVNNNKTITIAEDHEVIAYWGKDPIITYSSGNILEGLDDCETTQGETGAAGVHYMEYSISDGEVTVTNIRGAADGFGYTTGRVYLQANHTYRFNAETDGTWSSTENSGQVEAYLMLNGLNVGIVCGSSNFCHMDSNENFEFTPLISGEYWLRLDVNVSGETYTFSNISVEEIIDEIATPYGGNYVLPSSDPIWNDHQFSGWYCSDNTHVTSSTQLCENVDHTVFAHWNRTYHVFYGGIGAMKPITNKTWSALYNNVNGHDNGATFWPSLRRDGTDVTPVNTTWGDDYIEFNGTNSGVNLNYTAGSGATHSTMTIEVIFMLDSYYTGTDNTQAYIFGDANGGGVLLSVYKDGRIKFTYHNGSAYQDVFGPSLVLHKKYHVAATFNSGVVKLYVNGKLVANQTKSGTTIKHPTTTTNFHLGCQPSASGCNTAFFDGKIYDFGLYWTVLSDADIAANAGKDIVSGSTTYGTLLDITRTGYSADYSPNGYTFAGWYDDYNYSNEITDTSTFDKTEDTTLYAKWESTVNTTFYDDEYNVPISITNGSSGGVTFSWNSSKHYLTLNGTQTANTILGYVNNIFSTNDQWDLVVRYVSGSASNNGTNNGVIVDVATSSGTIGGSSGLSTRNVTGVQYPRSGSNTGTLTVSQLAATNGAKFALWLWKNGSYSVTFKNYVIQIDIVKRKTVYYNGTSWNDLARKKNGTVSNGTFVAPNGNNAGYLQTNGTNAWVNLGAVNLTNVTLEADVVMDSVPASGNACLVANYQVGGYGILIKNGYAQFAVHNSSDYVRATSTTAIEPGVRYKIAGVFDGSSVKLYVNGVLEANVAFTGTFKATTNNTIMSVGSDPNGSTGSAEWSNAKFYSVKISNKALAQSALGTNIVDSSTVRYYKVDADKTHYTVLPEVSSDNYDIPGGANSVRGNFDAWYTATNRGSNIVSATTKVPYNYNHAVFASYIGNSVQITYHLNGGKWADSTNGSLGVDDYNNDPNDLVVTFNGGFKTYQSYEYGSTINLNDYNNTNYVNISHPYGKVAKDNLQWCTQANGGGTCYNQATDYSTNEFCDASQDNCQVDLYVNWVNVNCAAAGSPTTFAGVNWYTKYNNKDNDGVCELYATSQSTVTGSYGESLSKLNSSYLVSGGKDYNAKLATIVSHNDSSNILQKLSGNYYIDTNSGTDSAPSGQWWYASGNYRDSATRYKYTTANIGVLGGWQNNKDLGVLHVHTLSATTYAAGNRTAATTDSTVTWTSGKYTQIQKTNGSDNRLSEWETMYAFGPDGNGSGSSSRIKYSLDRMNNNTSSYDFWDRTAAKLTVTICGGGTSNKTVVFTPVSSTKYHYKHNGTGTNTSYNYSGNRFFDAAGRAGNTATSPTYANNFYSSGYCGYYYTYTLSNVTVTLHYRPRIRVNIN